MTGTKREGKLRRKKVVGKSRNFTFCDPFKKVRMGKEDRLMRRRRQEDRFLVHYHK